MSAYLQQQLKASGVAQVIVVLHESATAAAATSASAALGSHFRLAETAPQTALMEARGLRVGGGSRAAALRPPPPMRFYPNLGIMFGVVDRAGLAALKADKRVAAVESAPVFSLIRPRVRAATAKPKGKVTWGIASLDVPKLWKDGLTGTGVLVGHLDTGADGKHPALRKAIRLFAEFDEFGSQVSPAPAPHDTDDHGTHTAATIAGRPVAGKHVGVAPGADLLSAIVIEGGDVVARILGGMDWAVGHKVRVLSMSLGLRGIVDDFLPITKILRKRNVLPVFAVGNEGPGTSRSPGNYTEALSVGAYDSQGLVADFSSSQRFARAKDAIVPDLVAPGVDVISAKPGSGYQSLDGTSMATPHVAGLAALLFEAKPGASASEVEKAIFRSCSLTPALPPSRANRGIPNAVRALAALGV